MWPRRGLAAALAALLATAAVAGSKDPPVPPGLDPGGIAVALIGPGLDYTDPKIAARLARDGEGELIGFDLVDQDRRPWPGNGAAEACRLIGCLGSKLATRLLSDAPSATLAPFRIPPGNETEAARAIGMIRATRARIVVVVPEGDAEPGWRLLEEAAARFPALLFVVPNTGMAAGPVARDEALAGIANLIVVERVSGTGPALAKLPPRANRADLAVVARLTGSESAAVDFGCDEGCAPLPLVEANYAAIRVAALAARTLAAEPHLDGAAVARRVLSTARPLPETTGAKPRYGVLE